MSSAVGARLRLRRDRTHLPPTDRRCRQSAPGMRPKARPLAMPAATARARGPPGFYIPERSSYPCHAHRRPDCRPVRSRWDRTFRPTSDLSLIRYAMEVPVFLAFVPAIDRHRVKNTPRARICPRVTRELSFPWLQAKRAASTPKGPARRHVLSSNNTALRPGWNALSLHHRAHRIREIGLEDERQPRQP